MNRVKSLGVWVTTDQRKEVRRHAIRRTKRQDHDPRFTIHESGMTNESRTKRGAARENHNSVVPSPPPAVVGCACACASLSASACACGRFRHPTRVSYPPFYHVSLWIEIVDTEWIKILPIIEDTKCSAQSAQHLLQMMLRKLERPPPGR